MQQENQAFSDSLLINKLSKSVLFIAPISLNALIHCFLLIRLILFMLSPSHPLIFALDEDAVR